MNQYTEVSVGVEPERTVIPIHENFGNPMLADFDEILMPDIVSYWPEAPGWKYLFAITLLLSMLLVWRAFRKWRLNRYRREALSLLSDIDSQTSNAVRLKQVAILLKSTALNVFPRAEIAGLSGADWVAYLNGQEDASYFDQGCADLLAVAQYQSESVSSADDVQSLINATREWIVHHRNPYHNTAHADSIRYREIVEERDD